MPQTLLVTALTVVNPDLYQIRQKVVGQQDKTRKKAIKIAFKDLLITLAGTSKIVPSTKVVIDLAW